MNPPPPILPAWGCVTVNANPTATAASTAFPPAFITSTPALDASPCTVATMALGACDGCTMLPASACAPSAKISTSFRKCRVVFILNAQQRNAGARREYNHSRLEQGG